MAKLNAQPFQKLEGSRNSWFDSQEKDKLLALPAQPFELATWTKAKVKIDYHAAVDNHFYSVPYHLIHQELEVRSTAQTVELFHEDKRVAAHVRSYQSGKFTTLEAHRPKSHQRYLEWTPSRVVHWARKTGPQCAKVVEQILASKPHPEQGFRSCLGIIRLGKGVGQARFSGTGSADILTAASVTIREQRRGLILLDWPDRPKTAAPSTTWNRGYGDTSARASGCAGMASRDGFGH